MRKKLSEQERLFCRLIVDKVKQGAAYAQAFGCKTKSAGTLANRLLKRVEIQQQIQQYETRQSEVAEKAALWTKADRLEQLQEMAEAAKEGGEYTAACKCIDLMNRMDGAYEPVSVEVTVDACSVASVLAEVLEG